MRAWSKAREVHTTQNNKYFAPSPLKFRVKYNERSPLSQVNSPGPDAGAYWLERRQSYRVKMAAPPAPSSSNHDGGGRKKHLNHDHHQQRRAQRPPSTTTTASVSIPFEADDRARRKAQTPVKDTTPSNNTVRPATTTATRSSTPACSKKRGKGGEKRRK